MIHDHGSWRLIKGVTIIGKLFTEVPKVELPNTFHFLATAKVRLNQLNGLTFNENVIFQQERNEYGGGYMPIFKCHL